MEDVGYMLSYVERGKREDTHMSRLGLPEALPQILEQSWLVF